MPNDTVISLTDDINPEYFSKEENEKIDREKGVESLNLDVIYKITWSALLFSVSS